MPNNTIVVISHDTRLSSGLVKSYVEGLSKRSRYEDNIIHGIKSSIVTYPPTTSNNFNPPNPNLPSKEFEIQEIDWTYGNVIEDATKSASVVIYAIPHRKEGELLPAFMQRVKIDVQALRKKDFSDAHVKRHLILVEDTQEFQVRHSEAFDDLASFAQTEGFRLQNVVTTPGHITFVDTVFNDILENTSQPNLFSRFLGAVFYGVLGGITHAFLLNPLARFYIEWQQSYWGQYEETW